MADNAKWYVIHTYSGYENAVKAAIEKTVNNLNLHDMVQRMDTGEGFVDAAHCQNNFAHLFLLLSVSSCAVLRKHPHRQTQ